MSNPNNGQDNSYTTIINKPINNIQQTQTNSNFQSNGNKIQTPVFSIQNKQIPKSCAINRNPTQMPQENQPYGGQYENFNNSYHPSQILYSQIPKENFRNSNQTPVNSFHVAQNENNRDPIQPKQVQYLGQPNKNFNQNQMTSKYETSKSAFDNQAQIQNHQYYTPQNSNFQNFNQIHNMQSYSSSTAYLDNQIRIQQNPYNNNTANEVFNIPQKSSQFPNYIESNSTFCNSYRTQKASYGVTINENFDFPPQRNLSSFFEPPIICYKSQATNQQIQCNSNLPQIFNEEILSQFEVENKIHEDIKQKILSKSVDEPPLLEYALSNDELFINPCALGFQPNQYWMNFNCNILFRNLVNGCFRKRNCRLHTFFVKLYNLLLISSENKFFKSIVGVSWITNRIFSVDIDLFAAVVNLNKGEIHSISKGDQDSIFIKNNFIEVTNLNYTEAGLTELPDLSNCKLKLMFHATNKFINKELSMDELIGIEYKNANRPSIDVRHNFCRCKYPGFSS